MTHIERRSHCVLFWAMSPARLLPLVALLVACSSSPDEFGSSIVSDENPVQISQGQDSSEVDAAPQLTFVPSTPDAGANDASCDCDANDANSPEASQQEDAGSRDATTECSECTDAGLDATADALDSDPRQCETLEYRAHWNEQTGFDFTFVQGTYAEGREFCRSLGEGWDLAHAGSPEEEEFMASLLSDEGQNLQMSGLWVLRPDGTTGAADECAQLGWDGVYPVTHWSCGETCRQATSGELPLCERTDCGEPDGGPQDAGADQDAGPPVTIVRHWDQSWGTMSHSDSRAKCQTLGEGWDLAEALAASNERAEIVATMTDDDGAVVIENFWFDGTCFGDECQRLSKAGLVLTDDCDQAWSPMCEGPEETLN